MLNGGRRLSILGHIKAAQRLAQEEARDCHQEGRVTRLALGLQLCRELADETFEDAMRDAERHATPPSRVRGV